jgi:hypothetical protein
LLWVFGDGPMTDSKPPHAQIRLHEDQMKRFFDLTFRPFFVITGIGTAAAGLYALWPRWTAETVGEIPFVSDYTIITQHWGIMVGLMGVFVIAAAFKVE